MFIRTPVALIALALSVPALVAQQPPAALPLSAVVMVKLPTEWHQAAALIKATEPEQQRFLKQSDEVFRQTVARLLARNPAADPFLKAQLVRDPSPAVRTTIVQVIAADARWSALPDTVAIIESVAATDLDATVSVTALETLRRWRMRSLNGLLTERIASAKKRGDTKALTRLTEEQERWFALERGNMLPAFLRTPPPLFSVKPVEASVRALAFGDFGNGSPEQKALAQTIANYHGQKPFDFAVTLGDNFYSAGMESPSDPRWQTWFEQLYGGMAIPFYAALGNHDWVHPDSPAAEILYSSKSPIWRMPASYYTFTAGPVQFFALDTQSVAIAEKQRQWLDQELTRSQARWKVVYGHHPIYSGGAYQDRPDLIGSLLPILANRADVYICGHDHNLQAIQPEAGVHFYIAGGGGAGLYELRQYERTLFASRTNGFAVLDADYSRLIISFVDAGGRTVYEDTIRKPLTSSASAR